MEAKESGEEVAAAHKEGDAFHAEGYVSVEIEIVAGADELLRVELVDDGIVSVGVILRIVEEIDTHAELQLLTQLELTLFRLALLCNHLMHINQVQHHQFAHNVE